MLCVYISKQKYTVEGKKGDAISMNGNLPIFLALILFTIERRASKSRSAVNFSFLSFHPT